MKAAIFEGAGRPLRITTVDDPEPKPGEVVLQIERCGICGSDLHVTEMDYLPHGSILGHEFVGTVVATAAGGPATGTRVTALPFIGCMQCADCEAGYTSQCWSKQVVGLGLPGGFAEYLALPPTLLHTLPAGIDFDRGALVEPLAVARHAVALAEGLSGSRVLVLGAGPIGVAATLFIARGGARHVVVSEPGADRRERAVQMGATATIDPCTQDVAATFAEKTGGVPDIIFECTGMPGLLPQALTMIKSRGQVVIAGATTVPETITVGQFLVKEPVIRYSMAYTHHDFEDVIDAIDKGLIDPDPLHTGTVPLDQLPNAFEALRTPGPHCKLLVSPR